MKQIQELRNHLPINDYIGHDLLDQIEEQMKEND